MCSVFSMLILVINNDSNSTGINSFRGLALKEDKNIYSYYYGYFIEISLYVCRGLAE